MAAASSKTKSSIAQPPPPLLTPKSITPKAPVVVPSFESLPVNKTQCEKALTGLLAHLAKAQEQGSNDLLQDEEHKLYLVVGLKKVPKRAVHKPIRLPLTHPVIDPKQSPVTLFVKDPQREYKDLLEQSKIRFVSRVVGLDKLRHKHKTFEAKRVLLKEADLFLVDDRVMVEVSKAIGKMWREAKKQPIPVTVTRKDLKAELERAIAATYAQVNIGTTLSIKFGSTGLHSASQLLDNLLSLIPQLAVRLPTQDGFDAIQTLHIKSSTSISLPIYNCSLDDQGRFKGPSEEEVQAIEEKKLEKQRVKEEKERREEEKEKRRIERSATKSGKGRAAKRDASESSVRAEEQESEQPKAKKSKKSQA